MGSLPPARLVAVRGAPRRLPRAPAVRRSARGFCGLFAPVGPSGVARPGGGPPLRAAARPPARGAVVRLSAGFPGSVGLGLSAPALSRRSGPRRPPAARPSLVGAASARSARGRPRASLRSGRALVFCRAVRPGPPARPAASRRRLRPRSSARGACGACAPLPRPPRRYALRAFRRRSRSRIFRSSNMSAIA